MRFTHILFLQGEDAAEYLNIYHAKNEAAVFKALLDSGLLAGEPGEPTSVSFSGGSDKISVCDHKGRYYELSINERVGTIGLCERVGDDGDDGSDYDEDEDSFDGQY